MGLFETWVGKNVAVTFRLGVFTTRTFASVKLLGADSTGVLVEHPNGPMFIPMKIILHVSLPKDAPR
jgi:hypothetical protein